MQHASNTLKRVLIVEDNLLFANSLGHVIELAGHEARTASNGRAALKLLFEFLPDLICLNIDLPLYTGAEFLNSYRMTTISPVPIIAFSEKSLSTVDKSTRAGIVAYFREPFDIGIFMRVINRLLDYQRNH
ncbi:MAG TPA: response regulator [Aggregatilineales bacterium]|nr:response regulator [Aggregatilineales bacterium]